ncbi:hypothetical protein [Streptomyces hoynatensis]|uniref:Uncharacterized protein n=1 Tax=Streptomyces hoynatensis TaxID=1141874 RepID=A0A3A9YPS1_9ACTN|nr:hypothetical protein [Streptomyces hoynatensis]RKN38005.1 hypothetical protein D7294_25795 [Streptomyces hoynatensis]
MTDRMHDRTGPVDLEQELGALLRQAGDSFTADPQSLAEGGLRRGRTRQFRQRFALVSGAAAAAAVAVAFSQLPGGGQDGSGLAAAAPETGGEMLDALAGLLPEGVRLTSPAAEGPETTAEPYVLATLDDGTDRTLDVAFTMSRERTPDWRGQAGCTTPSNPGWHCEEAELGDGSVLTLITSGPRADTAQSPSSGATWEAWLERPITGGEPATPGIARWSLSVTATPALAADAEAPLDLDRMAEVVEAPVWQQVTEELDERYGLPSAAEEPSWMDDTAAEDLRETFGALLPETVRLGALGSRSPGAATFEIHRADGTGSAQVTVNSYAPATFARQDRPEQDDDCRLAATLPDGSEVFRCAYEDESPEQEIYYDLYYPDGSSLDVTETAAADGDFPLSEEQLLQLVSDEQWRGLIGGPPVS